MQSNEAIQMAIQINARISDLPQDMVLYLDLSLKDDAKTINFFVADLHEASKETLRAFPTLPTTADPKIFHCTGTRLSEWTATLTLLDILLGYSYSKGNRAQMASWLLKCANYDIRQYTICNKVRYQGQLQDLSLPTARLFPMFTSHTPSVVHRRLQESEQDVIHLPHRPHGTMDVTNN